MTADVPRRLPRTQGQRVQNVSRTHAAQSLGGATAAARPVQNTTPTPTIYKPPTSGSAPVDRLKVNWSSSAPDIATDLTGSSHNITSWPSTFETVGTSVGLNPDGDDGGIYFFTPGVYAVNMALQVGADVPGSVLRLSGQIQSGDYEIFDVGVRGGDFVYPYGVSAGTSWVFYSPGGGVSGGGVGFKFAYSGGGNGWGLVWAEVWVQRIS